MALRTNDCLLVGDILVADRRQEADRMQEIGDRMQETGDRMQETECRRAELLD